MIVLAWKSWYSHYITFSPPMSHLVVTPRPEWYLDLPSDLIAKKMVFTRIIITWSFLKVLKNIYVKIRDSLKTADSSIFGPVGQKVKDSIENSDRCKSESACEVPGFKFLSEESRESDQPGTLQYLKGFKWIKGRNENQLLECSGFFQFEPRVLTKRNFQKNVSGNTTVQT